MAFFITQLIAAQRAPNVAAALYTCPPSTVARIDSLSVTNTDAAAHTITINLVTSGGAASDANATTKAQAIQPGQTWNSPNEVGKVLNAGDFIWVVASAANVLTIAAGGLQQQ